MVGKQFKHRNGNIYTVLFVTNDGKDRIRHSEHPPDVVYIGQNGKVWSRRLSDWARSFTEVDRGAESHEMLEALKDAINIFEDCGFVDVEPEKGNINVRIAGMKDLVKKMKS